MTSPIDVVTDMGRVPEAMRSLQALGRVDYVDLSTMHTAEASKRSAEEWARAVLEGGRSVRRFGFIPWRVLLGLRLGPSYAPGYVHGWNVTGRGESWIRLAASSWLMACNAVIRVEDGQVSAALFVRYDNLLARIYWGRLLSGVHRRLMPVILHQGEQLLAGARGGRPSVGAGR